MKARISLGAAALALFLAGCGGGGSDLNTMAGQQCRAAQADRRAQQWRLDARW